MCLESEFQRVGPAGKRSVSPRFLALSRGAFPSDDQSSREGK